MNFNQLNKIRKKVTVFMLLLSLSGAISQPLSVLAETEISNQAESSQVEKRNFQKENKDISKNIEEKTEQSIPMVTESSITDDTGESKEETTFDSPTKQSDQANRQSLTPVPAKTEDQLNQEVKKIFADNGYELLEDGSIRSTTGTSYRSNLFEVLQKVELIKAQNQAQARAVLGSAFFVMPRGTGVVYVDSNYGDAAFHWSQSNGNVETGYYAKKDSNGNMLWCVEPGAPLNWGANAGFTTSEVSEAKYIKASLAVYWGWEKQKSVVNAFYTEKLVQEITTGVKPTSISDLSGQGRISLAGYEAFKKATLDKIDTFYKRPSFSGKTYTVKLGETLSLADTNNILSYYVMSGNSANVNVSMSGNTVKITPRNDSNQTGQIQFKYNIDSNYQGASIIYQAPYLQDVIRAKVKDPARFSINLNVLKNGNAKIKKVDADTGKAISGAKFKLSYGGKQVEVVTNANGEADLKDVPHGTKVTIQEIQAANGYVLNKTPQTVTIEANKTVTATFKNKKQVGRLDLIKEDKETGNQSQGSARLDGAVYGLFETNGQKVKEVTLKKSGDKVTGSFENMQIMHDYYVQEVKAPEGYNLDSTKYPVNIAYAGQDKEIAVQSMTVKDQVIKGGVEIVKIGDKPLVKKVMDKVTGKSDNVKPKLEGAEFTITSKTTGKPVKVITTDKDGKASTGKTLPYDSYVMTETKTPEGYLTIDPIEFTISEEDQKFFWVLEDKIIEARLHLVKVDGETGKTIPLKDTTFKIWDRWANDGKGDYVSMRVPNSLEVSDEFKTNDKGELVTSDSLSFGKNRYEIRELRAPEGYLLATEPVVFSVTEADAGGVITIKFENMSQKGQVKIHKTGEKGISTVEKERRKGGGRTSELVRGSMKDYLTKKIGKPLTPPKAFIDWCHAQLPIYEWKNNQETLRSSNRTNGFLIKKRLTKASKLTFSTKFYSFAIILVSSTRIEIQSHDFWLEIVNGKEELHYEMTNFERFSKGEHLKAHCLKGKWYEGLLSNYGIMSGAYTNTVFYPNKWNEQLRKRSELRYLGLPLLDFRDIANIYKYRLEIEFCQKINAPVLADEIMFPSYRFIGGEYRKCVDMRVLTMKWLKQNKWRIKNTKKTFSELKMEEVAHKRKSEIVPGIEEYLDYRDFVKIPPHVGFKRFQRWIIENKINFKYYLDYLSLLEKLNIPLTHSLVVMPRNLEEKHDEAVNVFNQLKIELEEKAYRE